MIPIPPRSFRLALVLLLSGLSACSLVTRRDTSAVLGLAWPDSAGAPPWPDAVEPGRIVAAAALQGNRVVVTDGLQQMQYPGVRWVDAPAILLAELLQRRRAARGGRIVADARRLDLQLTAFHLQLEPDGHRRAVVAASGVLVCPAGAPSYYLLPVSARAEPAGDDPAALALAFARATDEFLTQLLIAAQDATPHCGSAASVEPMPAR